MVIRRVIDIFEYVFEMAYYVISLAIAMAGLDFLSFLISTYMSPLPLMHASRTLFFIMIFSDFLHLRKWK